MEKNAWDIATAIATCLAVITALFPIYISHFEKRAKARNLRMRIAVKMAMIIPSIDAYASPESKPEILFSISEITKKYEEIEEMLKESQALKPVEQDIISQATANLEFMIPIMKAEKLPPESAKSIIALLQKAIESVGQNEMLSGKPHQPWA